MAKVFLSHCWDDRDVALRLQRALVAKGGHNVFVDTDLLSYGSEWGVDLLNALMTADGVVALLTESSLRSPFVLSEVGAALAGRWRDPNKFLIPVLQKGLELPNFVRHLMIAQLDPLGDEEDEDYSGVVEKISFAIDEHAQRARVAADIPRVFVSHRHADEEIARALVECLRTRFHMKARDIRCTSVHPYRLRAGENADTKLREEVPRAEVVLGLITPLTNESTYVMFELGAAWGNNVWTCPLLVRGATAGNLPAPMQSRHPLVLGERDDCYQLLEDIGTETTLQRAEGPDVDRRVAERVEALTKAAASGG